MDEPADSAIHTPSTATKPARPYTFCLLNWLASLHVRKMPYAWDMKMPSPVARAADSDAEHVAADSAKQHAPITVTKSCANGVTFDSETPRICTR